MPKEVRKDLRDALRDAGEGIRKEAQQTTSQRLRSPRSGGGYRTVVRTRGIFVEQSLRKTTGKRWKWGVAQMRYSLVPALEDNTRETTVLVDKAMDQVADFFEREARWKGQGLLK